MSKDIPAMSSREFERLLLKGGAAKVRHKGSSHAIFRRVKGGKANSAPVVMCKKELSPKYIKLVFKQLGFEDAEIVKLLRE